MELGKVAGVNEINRVSRINGINRIKSSQQKIYHVCTVLGIISLVYIYWGTEDKSFISFYLTAYEENKKKNKACVLPRRVGFYSVERHKKWLN